jgi:hypothetical protein
LKGIDEYEAMVELLLVWKIKETQRRTSLVPIHPPQIHINLPGIEPEVLHGKPACLRYFVAF